jgi:uncharacterized membrane-anchored protein YhcB (DUF1043 family)
MNWLIPFLSLLVGFVIGRIYIKIKKNIVIKNKRSNVVRR